MSAPQAAAAIAAKGWKVVKLHGVVAREGGGVSCTCQKGPDCPSPGKHPVASNWQASASSDEDTVMGWWENDIPWNLGLLLGPGSGVVDVEFDDDAGREYARELGLDVSQTPTYQSSRSVHRLYKWTSDLPPVAVKKVRGLEVRIGGGGAAAQSVLPPSVHHSGVVYEWLPTLSPDEVELAELPEALAVALWNEVAPNGGSTPDRLRKPARAILDAPISEGGRNDTLHRYAVAQAFRLRDVSDPREQIDHLMTVRAVNLMQCVPPLSDEEVMLIARNAIDYRRKADARGIGTQEAVAAAEESGPPTPGDTAPSPPAELAGGLHKLTRWGLAYQPPRDDPEGEPEWWPGDWRLTIVHSDPRVYRLTVPAWGPLTADGSGAVDLSVAQFEQADGVASAVLARTGRVVLGEVPGQWEGVWNGLAAKAATRQAPGRRAKRGLLAKLIDVADESWPGQSSLRWATLAGWLFDALSAADAANDDDTPCSRGRPTWRADGTLWFGWTAVWEGIERNHRLSEGERLATKRRILAAHGTEDFRHVRYRHAGDERATYVVWTPHQLSLLERLAEGREGAVEV
jgi:hypothetical protein